MSRLVTLLCLPEVSWATWPLLRHIACVQFIVIVWWLYGTFAANLPSILKPLKRFLLEHAFIAPLETLQRNNMKHSVKDVLKKANWIACDLTTGAGLQSGNSCGWPGRICWDCSRKSHRCLAARWFSTNATIGPLELQHKPRLYINFSLTGRMQSISGNWPRPRKQQAGLKSVQHDFIWNRAL